MINRGPSFCDGPAGDAFANQVRTTPGLSVGSAEKNRSFVHGCVVDEVSDGAHVFEERIDFQYRLVGPCYTERFSKNLVFQRFFGYI